MILLQNLIALIFLFFVGVTVVGVTTYLLLCYRLQKYMVTRERDYWKRIGEPGISFHNSITRSKAFGQFIRNRGYLGLNNAQAIWYGESANIARRVSTWSSIFSVILFIISFGIAIAKS